MEWVGIKYIIYGQYYNYISVYQLLLTYTYLMRKNNGKTVITTIYPDPFVRK